MYRWRLISQMLPKVELKWYRTSVEGKQEHFFSTILEDATIINIDCNMPHCQDAAISPDARALYISGVALFSAEVNLNGL